MKLDCCVETCGWSTNATVIVQRDEVMWQVGRLLLLNGCTIQHGQRLGYEFVPQGERPVQRHMQPWNAVRLETDEAVTLHKPVPRTLGRLSSSAPVSPARSAPPTEMLVYETPDATVDAAYQTRVEDFIRELRGILAGKHLDPEDFTALLEEAQHIVEAEDPVRGPHAGLMTAVRTVLQTRAVLRPVNTSA